jgi:hypothetical protein
MDDDARHESGPIMPESLADLQAGLLDDAAAAALRERVRTDPDAAAMLAALDRIRGDLADLGTDEPSAPDVPAEVTARVGAALQAAPPPRRPAHSFRHTPRWQMVGVVAGIGAAAIGIVLGLMMLVRAPAPSFPAGPTAKSITVSRPASDLPLSAPQIAGLLSRSPDYGALADPQRRASCLSALGYPPATAVLGAGPVDMHGRPAVLILLPADTPKTVRALIVEPDCNAAHTGLLASTVVSRP